MLSKRPRPLPPPLRRLLPPRRPRRPRRSSPEPVQQAWGRAGYGDGSVYDCGVDSVFGTRLSGVDGGVFGAYWIGFEQSLHAHVQVI